MDARDLSLTAGAWAATIAPELGGAITGLARARQPVLRAHFEHGAEREARRAACFPMAPYCNRIAHGAFSFAGRDYRIAPNVSWSAHPLHGLAWRRAWDVEQVDLDACTLSLTHRPARDDADWPFAFTLRQRIALDERGMKVSLVLRNDHAAPAPAGIGLHPFFPHHRSAAMNMRAVGVVRNDEDMLPTGAVDPVAFSDGVGLDEARFDNDVVGWDGAAEMSAPGFSTVRLAGDGALRALRLFTATWRNDVAIEPVSHGANAINDANAASPMAVLAPGEVLEGAMTISVCSHG